MMAEWNCMFNHELLADYASGNYDPKVRSVVERHLAKCPQCRREIMELEKAWWALGAWNLDSHPLQPRLNDLRLRIAALNEPPPSLWTRTSRYVAHQWNAFRPAPKFAVAAALGLVLMLPTAHWLAPLQDVRSTNQSIAVERQTETTITANASPSQGSERERDDRFQQAVDSGRNAQSSLSYTIRINDAPIARGGLAPSANFVPTLDNERALQPVVMTRIGLEPAW